ncbi:MAG: class I SAM-dependent methyltransferase [bacterium]
MKDRNTTQQNNYHVIARFYDDLMGEKKYLIWGDIIADVVAKYKIPKGICIDVACGTGNISQILLKQGFAVVGVDRSKYMLAIAKKKLPQVDFVCSDIRDFELKQKNEVVFAVSFYDSLNYLLTDKDILSAFQAIARNMPSGTIFLFDMNTREHILVSQKNKPRVFEYDDFYSIFRFGGENRIWTIDMDFFIKQPDGKFQLIKEHHKERAYDEKDTTPLFQKVGFELLEVRSENKVYEDGKEHLSRLYFIVKRR